MRKRPGIKASGTFKTQNWRRGEDLCLADGLLLVPWAEGKDGVLGCVLAGGHAGD